MNLNRTFKLFLPICIWYFSNGCAPSKNLQLLTLQQNQQSTMEIDKETLSYESSFLIDGHLATKKDAISAHTVSIWTYPGGTAGTGVIIAENAILTAAHNVVHGTSFQILLDPNSYATEKDYRISTNKKVVHENFDNDLNDLAILFFDSPLPPGYKPVALSNSSKDSSMGQDLIIAGYGSHKKTWLPSGDTYGHLRFGPSEVAFRLFSSSRFYTLNYGSNAGACSGDSGGPAFIVKDNHLVLVGITSQGDWFPPIPACSLGSIWTRVSYYYEWIQNQLNRQKH